mmetsp:Transcript_9038/g.13910  ORF Transcript_9038/g.13910 Transcript_9038/m.13910 type:complete len:350 (+) Transcript_9038:26-1075(+)|eukprot:CAMPEP_0197313140 /NCGR_PEP_ID=MMETSP0891-20130614/25909_1 /TAXON_ID=44058 ORGANISM="Aureoumbra lagunensis, Strain CCMP1510" /NCGR_SAMPLE_ID=MMETSP0891 /ASSEMBLY_ACC=CAM_ASM_000534 /LENGTH=349 /DNA_ID=CAMNT_0042800799 /DNA_START=11 /DNA_END=1060 /DNA_ORIENTATION=+
MFDPNRFQPGAKKEDDHSRQIQSWAMELLPQVIADSFRADPSYLFMNVREVACGDPTCAPIDTVLAFIFRNGRRAMTGIPLEMRQIKKNDIAQTMNDLSAELIACHENREYTHPGALPPISSQGEAALQRIAGVLRRELLNLKPSDIVGVCAATIDFLEQVEEDAARTPSTIEARQTKDGQTPARTGIFPDPSGKILAASQKNDVEAVRIAITQDNISPSFANSLGQTPLHISAMWGNIDVTQLLIQHGANINATNQLSASTPLHVAASSNRNLQGRIACARILLQAGADATKADADGLKPFQKVKREEAPELYELLQSAAISQSNGGTQPALQSSIPSSPETTTSAPA